MLILFKIYIVDNRYFTVRDRDIPDISLKDLPDNEKNEINDEIISILASADMFPGRNVNRLNDTDVYTIETLPAEEASDFDDIYFSKFEEIGFFNFDPLDYDINFKVVPNNFGLYIPTDRTLANDANTFSNSDQSLIEKKLDNLFYNTRYAPGLNLQNSSVLNSQFIAATLYYANFTECELRGSNFNNADLRYADLKYADLTPFKTTGGGDNITSLVNANLRHADLTGTNFSYADLSGADLRMAILNFETNFTGCNLTDCKLAGTNWEETIHNDTILDSNIADEYIGAVADADEYTDADADQYYADELLERAEAAQLEAGITGLSHEETMLRPLVINPNDKFGDNNCTYESIVTLLTPKIRNVKKPISEMIINRWYGIFSLGNTTLNTWRHAGVNNDPHIGKVFKCIYVPPIENNEAIVYESVEPCLAIHELSRPLDLDVIFKTFIDCVGKNVIDDEIMRVIEGNSSSQENLDAFAIVLYNYISYILLFHNADETAESWTHVYDDIDHTKILVKHAIFNEDEGVMYHPRFDYSGGQGSNPDYLIVITIFLSTFPHQIQAAWAQYYIKEFIEGYGQEVETFDPTVVSPEGFIASCINGNIEKMLLSIRTAITQFYPPGWGLEPVTEENEETEKKRVLKATITGSEFEKYFFTTDDDSIGPSLEGYRMYIKRFVNPELREQYLNLLEDQEVIDTIQANIDITSGGRKSTRLRKRKKTFNRKLKKTIKKKKLYKRKKTIKKEKLYKRKRTIKKNS